MANWVIVCYLPTRLALQFEVLHPFRHARGYTWRVMLTARRYLGRSIFGASISTCFFLMKQENPGLTTRNIRSFVFCKWYQIRSDPANQWLLQHGISLQSSKYEITKVENLIQQFEKNCMGPPQEILQLPHEYFG